MPIVCLSADKEGGSATISFEVNKDDTVDQVVRKFRHGLKTTQAVAGLPTKEGIKAEFLLLNHESPEAQTINFAVEKLAQMMRRAILINAHSLSKTN